MPRVESYVVSVFAMLMVAIHLNVSAQEYNDSSPLDMRLNDACGILGGDAPKFDTVFSASFLQKVPPIKMIAGMKPLVDQYGKCIGATITKRVSEWVAEAEGVSDKGYIFPISITIESKAPYRIMGFFVKPPRKQVVSFDGVVSQLKELDGRAAMWVYDIDEQKGIAGYNESDRLPTGSAFKIYVLGALESRIQAGELSWDQVVNLDTTMYSLPSGVLQSWPHGAPVTINTLATQMISISDNTATDHLISIVGRRFIEDYQTAMGHLEPSVNKPFLTTRELFALKFSDGAMRARNYANTEGESARRLQLDSLKTQVALDDIMFESDVVLPDKVEWFASPIELCAAMSYFGNWLSRGQNSPQMRNSPALDILSVNPGLDINSDVFTYIGYKGGSETGVLNMTYLLQRADGRRYAMSISWMDLEKEVALVTFSGIVSTAIKLLENH